MNKKILMLLEKNARMSAEDIAVCTNLTVSEVEREISEMQRVGIIRGYKCIIDYDKIMDDTVSAVIELNVTPKAGLGFEDVAHNISHYPQVESVSLMSGSCDLRVVIRAATLREISAFVANELATMDGVTSTATQFIMRRYKDHGVELFDTQDYGRGKILL